MKLTAPFILLFTLAFSLIPALRASSPLENAASVWDFADTANRADTGAPLKVSGNVRLGVPLSESETAESRLRGGDGFAADFSEGGCLDAGTAGILPGGRERTCYLRFRASAGDGNRLIFSHGTEKAGSLISVTSEGFESLQTTTANRTPLRGRALFAEMPEPDTAPNRWHDVVLRVSEAKLEWFVDGRCYDEDFTLGDLHDDAAPVLFGTSANENAFTGQIDTAALWNRALTDEEITELSGGPDRIDARTRTDRGNGENLQYWMPPNQYAVGDCMPFYADGLFHFMYLLDKGHHGAKNVLGAHQWMQATSPDLIHWTHQPFVVAIDRQREGSICTGSVFFHNGTYYAFYANRAFRFQNGDFNGRYEMFGRLACAKSQDGIHFEKTRREPLIQLPPEYATTTRDPVVFQDPNTNLFHIYFTDSYNGRGCWGHAVSEDLENWNLTDPIYAVRDGEPECPDWFEWGGKYYLIANHRNGYWLWSDSPIGPWKVPETQNALMPGIINVPKTAPFGSDRRIICGWTREHGFGGHAVFHELLRRPDGTLGEKFVPEMIPEAGAPAISEENADLTAARTVPFGDARISFTLTFPPESSGELADISFHYDNEHSLTFSPASRSVTLGSFRIEEVDFSTGKLDAVLIIKGDLIDLELSKERTVTDTLPESETRTFSFQTEGEGWKLEKLEIAPLVAR